MNPRQYAFILACLFAWWGCDSPTTNTEDRRSAFALYWLANPTIPASQVWSRSVDSLDLAPTPFLTEEDLTSYFWSTHTFTARPGIDTLFDGMAHQTGRSGGVPFVVVASGSPVYVGSVWWAYSSLMPQGPYIMMPAQSPYHIQFDWPSDAFDVRFDKRIHDALESAGVLVEG